MAGKVFFSVSMSLDGFIAPGSVGERSYVEVTRQPHAYRASTVRALALACSRGQIQSEPFKSS
jgi:hypothetical protein